MQVARTPDERFEALPNFPFEPHYAEIDDGEGGRLRVHYVDEGPRDGPTVLLLHGEPSWCFLYRHIIPQLVDGGCRVIAPDLVGFGKSDKPTEKSDYTYNRHVNWMQAAIIDHLVLRSGLGWIDRLATRRRKRVTVRESGDFEHRVANR